LGFPVRNSPWFDLFRPFTLFPVLAISLFIGLVAADGGLGVHDWLVLLLAGSILTVTNGCSNLINQVTDLEDLFHPTKQDRPVAAGLLNPVTVLTVAVTGWGAVLLLSVLFLPVLTTVALLVIMSFAWAYSVHPLRMKDRLFVGNAVIATPRGGLGIFAVWVLFRSPFDPLLWEILLLTVPFVYLANSGKDVADLAADLGAGVRNFATVFGERICRWITAMGYVWVAAVVLVLGYWRWDPWLWAVVPLAVLGVRGALRWEGSRVWNGFYLSYALLIVLVGLPSLVHL
jgi:4-hydroxybenzoate polyprenyltransferase